MIFDPFGPKINLFVTRLNRIGYFFMKNKALTSYRYSGKFTLQEILKWSVMGCDDIDKTVEIQKLVTKLKLLISKREDEND